MNSGSNRKILFIFSALALGLLLLFRFNYFFAVGSRIILQFPAGGASFWKQYLYLSWLVVAPFIVAFLPAKAKIRKNLTLPFILLAVSGILYNLYLADKYDLHPYSFALYLGTEELSSNSLFHSHVQKGAIGILLDLAGARSALWADAGVPYRYFINPAFFILTILLFVWALRNMLVFIAREFYLKPDPLSLFALLTVGFYFLRTLIDGGALAPEFLAALFTLAVRSVNQRMSLKVKSLLLLCLVSIAMDHLTRQNFWVEPYSWLARDILMHICFLQSVFSLGDAVRSKSRFLAFALLLITCFYLNRNYFFWHEWRHLNSAAGPDERLLLTSFKGETYPGEVIREDGPAKQYLYRTGRKVSFFNFYRANRIPPGYTRVFIDGKSCSLKRTNRVYGEIRSLSAEPLPTECSGGFFPFLKVTWYESKEDLKKGRYQGAVGSCIPDQMTFAVANRMLNCGLSRAIILPYESIAFWPYRTR